MSLLNNINIDRFLYSLKYMWQGMLCIFIVIGVIILFVLLMNFISYRIEVMKQIKEGIEEKDN